MSRSYNHRNKDNTDNEYLKYYFGPSSFKSKTEGLDEREKRYKTKLKNKSGTDSVPRFYKRYCNRKIKNDFDRHLEKCLKEERYDDILTPIIKRNHKYDYF
jgi:hypothetical protein